MTFFSKVNFRARLGSTRSLRQPFSKINIPKLCVKPCRYKRVKNLVDLTLSSYFRAILMIFLRMSFFVNPPIFGKNDIRQKIIKIALKYEDKVKSTKFYIRLLHNDVTHYFGRLIVENSCLKLPQSPIEP